MELAPRSEMGKGTWSSREETPPQNPQELSNLLDETIPWSLEVDNGVLFAKDELALLDRPESLPMAALAHLDRVAGDSRVCLPWMPPRAQDKELVAYTVLRDYYSATSSGTKWLKPILIWSYRGMCLDQLTTSNALAYLWDTLPTARKREILTSSDEGDVTLPMTRFDSVFPTFTALLARGYDPNGPDYVHGDPRLRSKEMKILWRKIGDKEYSVWVILDGTTQPAQVTWLPRFRYTLPGN
jgi:hypothetical protein